VAGLGMMRWVPAGHSVLRGGRPLHGFFSYYCGDARPLPPRWSRVGYDRGVVEGCDVQDAIDDGGIGEFGSGL
jgi:hypothetical protein